MYRLPASHPIPPQPRCPLSALGKGQWAGPGISRVGQRCHCHWLLLWLLLPALWTLENATYSKVPQRLTSTTWRTTAGGRHWVMGDDGNYRATNSVRCSHSPLVGLPWRAYGLPAYLLHIACCVSSSMSISRQRCGDTNNNNRSSNNHGKERTMANCETNLKNVKIYICR